ncbi:restriction endonuclease [Thalassotalea sp. M1531]|uniref:Restriction endonuclease n=1 Tax=Thalassotalea algicola TaxID=2716224 RepID=A0A7Y0L9X3_9GAMM|nr:restriction endonuclease [Thalassotalea algicola]NMP30660.1 restriction endonuclease [Thalassotalea algicola]
MGNILLVRGPENLLKAGIAGYGWSQINLSSFESFSVVDQFIKEKEIDIGRQRNQIKRFYDIKGGDIIVVPVSRAIVIGIAKGEKSYAQSPWNGANRVSVEFFKNEIGDVIRIPRYKLSEGVQSRLKIRMTVANLNEFSDEFEGYIESLQNDNSICFDSIFQQKVDREIESLKEELLSRIVSGKTTLESGGYGLEKLIAELMEIEGYEASIEAKNKTHDDSDVDIIATKADTLSSSKVYIQCKHHSGVTSRWGVKQLALLEESSLHVDMWLITTGSVSEDTKTYAAQNNIGVMEGVDLISWIFSHIHELSPGTKEKLGLSIMPKLIT